MQRERTVGSVVLFLLVLMFAAPSQSWAIPAFARKYDTTCARCHSTFPQLNNYGWNFKLNGYQVPGDETAGKAKMPEDPLLYLLQRVPLAVRVDGQISHTAGTNQNVTWALAKDMSLFFADSLAPKISVFLEMAMQEDTTNNSYSVGAGNFRAEFTHLLKSHPTAVNLEVGRFDVGEFGNPDGLRLTQTDYAIDDDYAVTNPGNGAAFPLSDEINGANLYGAFGTGIGKEAAAPPAGETEGAGGAASAAELQELQSELKPGGEAAAAPSAAAPPAAPARIAHTDYDTRKGLFYQVGIGSHGPDANNSLQGFAQFIYSNPRGWWVGPLFYFGTQGMYNVTYSESIDPATGMGTPTIMRFNDDFRRVDLEASGTFGPDRSVAGVVRKAFTIHAALMDGRDSNIDGAGTHINADGGYLEGQYIIDDRDLAIIRYDRLHSTPAPIFTVNRIVMNYTRMLQRNLKVGVELVPDLSETTAAHQNGSSAIAFYDFAF